MTSTKDKVQTTLEKARASAKDAQNEVAAGRVVLAAKRRELSAAQSAPPPLKDMKELAVQAVRREAAAWVRNYGPSVLGALALDAAGGNNTGIPITAMVDRAPFGFICAGDPERAAEMIASILKQCPSYESGPPLAERDRTLAALRKEVADLERADEELTNSVIAAGVSISVRPDVLARRQEEADRADAAERVIENRAKRQARLNEAARESGVPAVRLVG